MKNVIIKRVLLIGVFCFVTSGFGLLAYYICQTQDPENQLKQILVNNNNCIVKAFFAPDDNPRDILIDLIKCEKKSILTAIYTFTDKDLAMAFIDAHSRGVKIEVIADRNYGGDRFSRIAQLANHKIPIWIYQTSQDEKSASLMHDKFCIFEDNILRKSILWTGSYNFTRRANIANQENIIVIDNPDVVNSFKNHFEILKTRSLLISGHPEKSIPKKEQSQTAWWENIFFLLGWS